MRERVREGVRSGFVAAAATAGVLLGFGLARGAAMRPINSVAHILIGTRAYYMVGVDWLVTPLALLVHVAAVCAAGTVFALLTVRLRGGRMFAAAVVYAVALWLVIDFALPARVRPGFESGLSSVEILSVYLVMALVLAQMLARERGASGGTIHHRAPPVEPGN
jgi:hypothetical protein